MNLVVKALRAPFWALATTSCSKMNRESHLEKKKSICLFPRIKRSPPYYPLPFITAILKSPPSRTSPTSSEVAAAPFLPVDSVSPSSWAPSLPLLMLCGHTTLHTVHSVSCLTSPAQAMRAVGSSGEHRWPTISQCCEAGPHLPPHFRSSSVQKPGAPYHIAGRTHPYSMMGSRGQFRGKAVGVPTYLGHSDIDRMNKTFISTDHLLLALPMLRHLSS